MNRFILFLALSTLTLLAATLTSPVAVLADDQAWTNSDGFKCNLCWREKASPDCRSSVIFSTALYYRASTSNIRDGKGGGLFVFGFGTMRNLDRKNALGGLLWASGDDDGSRYGLGVRYRRWLAPRACVDLTAGILFAGVDNYQRPKFPGFVSEASIALFGLVSLDARFEMYRYDLGSVVPLSGGIHGKGTARALYLGVTGRSWGAFVIPVAAGILTVIYIDDMTTIE